VAGLDTTITEDRDKYHKYVAEIEAFLRYHIQDNAVLIHGDNTTGLDEFDEEGNFVTPYETAYLAKEKAKNGTKKTFRKVKVKTDKPSNQILVIDEAGNTRRVMTEKTGLYNLLAREYTYVTKEEKDKSITTFIHNSSSAVVHLIDGPLMYKIDE
jgi:hypothetical protein